MRFSCYVFCVCLHSVLVLHFFFKVHFVRRSYRLRDRLRDILPRTSTKQNKVQRHTVASRCSTNGTNVQVSRMSLASTLLRCRYTRVFPSPRMSPGTAPAVPVRVTFLRRGFVLVLADERGRGIVAYSYGQTHPLCTQGCTSKVVTMCRHGGRVALHHVAWPSCGVHTTDVAYLFQLHQSRDAAPKCIRITIDSFGKPKSEDGAIGKLFVSPIRTKARSTTRIYPRPPTPALTRSPLPQRSGSCLAGASYGGIST